MHMFMLHTYAHIACYSVQSKVCLPLLTPHVLLSFEDNAVASFRDFLEGIFCTYVFIYLCADTMKIVMYCIYSQMILGFSC